MMCYHPTMEWSLLESLSDRLDCYLNRQESFRQGYSFKDLWIDIRDDLMTYEPEGPHELTLLDWREECLTPDEALALDAPRHREKAQESRAAKRDPWLSVKKLTKDERGRLVRFGHPFNVIAVRLIEPQHQRRNWERKSGKVWALLIDGGWIGRRILTMAPNYYRDKIFKSLPVPTTMRLVEGTSRVGRTYFDLQSAPTDRATDPTGFRETRDAVR